MPDYKRGLLDTSVVIDLPNPTVAALITEAAISAITLAELATGPHATHDPVKRAERQQRLQWAENTFDVLPFSTEAARHYGHAYALVLAGGRKPRGRLVDLMIAATAVANDLPLLTRNPKDFVGLDSIVQVIPV
ncbi:MAG: type II toxin-antitoxin system VapC family toxin [Kutzneria sp.]|nr:type II toxin-antitoxin system VapC family toxin [Kutzneria sp.]MBV9847596.1 type II toxin-antitoxin system VapC family toxin [Kutzneria sp.]